VVGKAWLGADGLDTMREGANMISRRSFLNRTCYSIAGCCVKLRAGEAPVAFEPSQLIEPAGLAAALSASGNSPHVICVAFPVLYRQRHIAGAVLAGPGSKPEGIEALRSALQRLKTFDAVVLYCGCCPMQQCPNIRPAYAETNKLGFTNVRVLDLRTNFHNDWTAKGYPVAS
jgi:hypothetical protein